MSSVPLSLTEKLAAAWPTEFWRDCHVVVATSGGADSVALLRGLVELREGASGPGKLIVAHLNHRTRGDASDADAQWVAELAAELGLDVELGQAAARPASEEAARQYRYGFLREVAQRLGARYVVTAHTADDQVETVLMRLLRGSGIEGLAGIPRSRRLDHTVSLVRPLLDVSRQEVEGYLAGLAQVYRTDATNRESHFTRNWVRNELLPMVRQHLPGDPDLAIRRLAEQASRWSEAFDQLAGPLADAAVRLEETDSGAMILLDCEQLAAQPAIVVQQVCRRAWRQAGWPQQAMGMQEWQRLAAALAGNSPAFQLPGEVTVRREGTRLVLWRANSAASGC